VTTRQSIARESRNANVKRTRASRCALVIARYRRQSRLEMEIPRLAIDLERCEGTETAMQKDGRPWRRDFRPLAGPRGLLASDPSRRDPAIDRSPPRSILVRCYLLRYLLESLAAPLSRLFLFPRRAGNNSCLTNKTPSLSLSLSLSLEEARGARRQVSVSPSVLSRVDDPDGLSTARCFYSAEFVPKLFRRCRLFGNESSFPALEKRMNARA